MYITGARESSLCPTATRPLLLERVPVPLCVRRERSFVSVWIGGPRGLSSGRTRQFRDGTRDPRAATHRFRVDDEYFFFSFLPSPPFLPSFVAVLFISPFFGERFDSRGESEEGVIGLRFVSDTFRLRGRIISRGVICICIYFF